VSKIAQGMERKVKLGEEAELTRMSAASRPRISSWINAAKIERVARPSAV